MDLNETRPRLPANYERRVAYGQLLRVVEFCADLPVITGDDGVISQQPTMLLLAVIRPVKLLQKSKKLGTPYYQDGEFLPIQHFLLYEKN